MGQRLNLEIHDGNYTPKKRMGRLVANAYYHWSGYSESAIEILKVALDELKNSDENDPFLRAIKALEATGAGLTDKERSYAKDELKGYTPKPCDGRNDGLIAVSPDGTKDTRVWEEGRIEIHLNPYEDTDYVKYEVFFKRDEAEEKRESERYGDPMPENVEIVDFNFNHIPLNKVGELEELVRNNDYVKIMSLVTFIK